MHCPHPEFTTVPLPQRSPSPSVRPAPLAAWFTAGIVGLALAGCAAVPAPAPSKPASPGTPSAPAATSTISTTGAATTVAAEADDHAAGFAAWRTAFAAQALAAGIAPRTVRDVIGLAADSPLRPIGYLEDDKTRVFLQGLQAVDLRAQLLSIEGLMSEGVVDEYALFRDIWLQRRTYQINQAGRKKDGAAPDETLPPYLMQDDPTSTAPGSSSGGE